MTHLALHLTTRSEVRNTSSSCFTSNSEVRSNDSSFFMSNSEVRSNDSYCFMSNSGFRSKDHTHRHALRLKARSEAMTHLALCLTARSKARNYIYTPPFREGPFGLYQDYLESVQTLHEIEVCSTHQQPVHPC
jgi:hypothetical protein